MPDKYAVFGNPVAHSRSPQIHRAFAAQTGDTIEYQRILVPEGKFRETARQFLNGGGRGMNVTVPCKEEAFAFAGRLTPRAQRAGAVNTLKVDDDDTLLGDNTDGRGLLTDLADNLRWPLKGQRILLLGAGGAARGVLEPLLTQTPTVLVIGNRTESKAQSLAQSFGDLGHIQASSYEALVREQPFDLVINATSASLSGKLLPLPDSIIGGNSRCYDMLYGARPTPFMDWAGERGVAQLADGLGMLVEQAAESFFLWRGKRPHTNAVIEAIRAELLGN